MSYPQNKVPLGAVLQQAGLVSVAQVKQALEQQNQTSPNLRIGEILAAQGRIKPQTADFFAERWATLATEQPQQPIGQYFKQAALLDEQQIQIILQEQKQTQLKFGEVAISKGWLQPKTVNFFLRYLAPKSTLTSNSLQKTQQSNSGESLDYSQQIHESFLKIKLKLLNLKDQGNYSEQTLIRVLWWTGGQSFLTQTLFQLLTENQDTLIANKEAEQIDYLVQTQLLNDWENQKLSNHLKNLEAKLLNNQNFPPNRLLRLYQQILSQKVTIDDSPEQQELLKLGLVVKQEDKLAVANRIYRTVFNPSWLKKALIQPSAQNSTAITIVPQKSTAIVPVSQPQFSLLRPKNLLLVLALIGLLSVLFNNIAKRIAVRTAFEQGNQLLKEQFFTQALAQYNHLLYIDSNYFQAWTNRGYALAGLQQYEEMRQSCNTATIIEPNAVYAWNCQGEALHNLNREAEAIVAFDKAIALDQTDAIFLINKSESLKSLGKNEESLSAIKRAIKVLEQQEAIADKMSVSSELAVALTFLGNGYRNKQQYEIAINTYNRALEYSPNYFPAQISKSIALSQIQRYQEAKNELERILNNADLTTPKQAQTWFYLGKTFCESQQPIKGVAAFEQAIKLKPDYQAAQQAKRQCTLRNT
ncbi:MAG: tetratricopeptide repeat protein [Waterburya sp.]